MKKFFGLEDSNILEIEPKKKYYGFFSNALIALLELIGAIISLVLGGAPVFRFYTFDSNVLSGILSIIFMVYCGKAYRDSQNIPPFVSLLKLIATSCLTLTFLVVIFVLGPASEDVGEAFESLLFHGSNSLYHVLCPILSIASFLLFDVNVILNWKAGLIPLGVTLFYGIIIIILNVQGIVIGPYIFLRTDLFEWYKIFFMIIGVMIGNYLIIFLLIFLSNKIIKTRVLGEININESAEINCIEK